MSQNNFFNKILKKMNDNDKLTKSINLFQYPTNKSKNSPRSPIYPINFKQQIDIIQLPKDKEGFEYALVVADYKRYIGIEPLKKIDSKSVLQALQRIINEIKYLNILPFYKQIMAQNSKVNLKSSLVSLIVKHNYNLLNHIEVDKTDWLKA